jgi:inner membrane protein involved in colicin E2 resistance
MDNVITGAIAVVIFLAFVLGLAESIGQVPFILISVIVSGMIVTDYLQSAKEGLKKEKEKKANPAA